jgi:hypothetical protein
MNSSFAIPILTLAIPFLGSTVASAPGFVYHLPFLDPLSNSGSLAAKFVEGLVPAFVLSHIRMGAVLAVHRQSLPFVHSFQSTLTEWMG